MSSGSIAETKPLIKGRPFRLCLQSGKYIREQRGGIHMLKASKRVFAKRTFVFTLSLALTVLHIFHPVPARAALGEDFTITGGINGTDYTYGPGSGDLTILQNGTYTIAMATAGSTKTTDYIVVTSGVTANITLSGVSIDSSATGSAFDIREPLTTHTKGWKNVIE
jgi:hypothetical protein